MMAFGRPRSVILTCALISSVAATAADDSAQPARPIGPRPLVLTAAGAPRLLPENILGGSAEPLIEHLLGDPAKAAQVKATAPAVLRFPGGSQANFYNWRSGLIEIDARRNSSAYVRFWAEIAPKVARAFPNGIKLADYAPFVREVGSEVILVPNLETSTLREQVEWFRQLAADRMLPRHIELGNEFYLGMLGDPESMRKWRDLPTTMRVMREFEQALRPIAGAGAKFAVQSAASAFWVAPDDRRPFWRRMLKWDADLAPAPWFEAVTLHLYPVIKDLMRQPGGDSPEGLFRLLMERADAGVDHVLNDVARRVPGKELWITEWSPRGGDPFDAKSGEPVTPAMNAHVGTRMTLAFLRHRAVTKSLYFMLSFADNPAFQAYVRDAGGYKPLPTIVALSWLNKAANHGGSFQRVVEIAARDASATTKREEGYAGIEGGLFRNKRGVTLIVQNATNEARYYDPTENGKHQTPQLVEVIATPDLASQEHHPAQVVSLPADRPLLLPPYSIARVMWQ